MAPAFILLAWRQGVAVARGKPAKGRFVSVYICIFGFTKVQVTERIFIYNLPYYPVECPHLLPPGYKASYPNTAISSFNASFLLSISEHQRKNS